MDWHDDPASHSEGPGPTAAQRDRCRPSPHLRRARAALLTADGAGRRASAGALPSASRGASPPARLTSDERGMPPVVLIMLGRTISIALPTLLAGCAAPAAQSASDTTAASVTGQPSMSAAPTLAFTVEEADEPPAGAIEILLTFGPKFEPEEVSASAGTIVFFLQNDQ